MGGVPGGTPPIFSLEETASAVISGGLSVRTWLHAHARPIGPGARTHSGEILAVKAISQRQKQTIPRAKNQESWIDIPPNGIPIQLSRQKL